MFFLKQYLTTLRLNLVVGFAAFYVVHGVLREKEYELFAFVLATLLVLVYCTVECQLMSKEGTVSNGFVHNALHFTLLVCYSCLSKRIGSLNNSSNPQLKSTVFTLHFNHKQNNKNVNRQA